MIQVNVGHTITNSYTIVDQNGNPMVPQPALDSPAVWTDTPSAPGVDSAVIAPDGSSAVISALAPGSDTLSLSVIIGGKTYTASALFTINAAPQVVSGVVIDTVVS